MSGIPLIAHVVFSFHVGGLENGVVNLLNRMPADRYRHVLIAMTDCSASFCERVTRADIEFISLHKPPGQGIKLYPRMFHLLRRMKPALVHTRNLAALEMTVPAALAGIGARVHGEHGWDQNDPGGVSRRYRLLRRLYSPFVTHYIALSGQISSYLKQDVGIASRRVSRICNGVDTERFFPVSVRQALPESPFHDPDLWVVGSVGRLQAVKDQVTLVAAFGQWLRDDTDARSRARLMLVGDGPLRPMVEQAVQDWGVGEQVWLAGERSDIPQVMRGMDLFVLPSQAEGISNTILEAMASGLPVLATAVGGNGELVVAGDTGVLVPPLDPQAMAHAMKACHDDPERCRSWGEAGRMRVEAEFSLDAMVGQYLNVYDTALGRPVRTA